MKLTRKDRRRIGRPFGMLMPLTLACAGCATAVHDQVAVPGTKQRILVGHDGWPFPRMWVLEDGTLHSMRIVREDK